MANTDLATYWRDLATKAGLSDEEAGSIAESFGNEKVRNAFSQAFVREPDFQAGLAKAKTEWQGKVEAAAADSTRYRDWYENQAKEVFENGQANIVSLKQYEDLYGPLDAENGVAKPAIPENVVTRDYLDKMLREQSDRTVTFVKESTRASGDYQKRFKEPLPVDEFVDFATKQQLPVAKAYELFIQPKVAEQQEVTFAEKLKEARAEGAKEALSRHQLPTTASRSEPHAIFDKREAVPDDPQDSRAEARNAFMEALHAPRDAA